MSDFVDIFFEHFEKNFSYFRNKNTVLELIREKTESDQKNSYLTLFSLRISNPIKKEDTHRLNVPLKYTKISDIADQIF